MLSVNSPSLDYPFPEASAAQYRSLEFIEQAVRQLGSPDGLAGPEALEALRVSEGFTRQRLLGPDEVGKRLIDCGVRQCYQDPKLNDPNQYVGFVKKLVGLNLVELSCQPATETVGLFFVKKKGGKHRLIVDCRRSNCHFSEPLPIKLATGEAMSRIHARPDEPLYMASADLQNAFYTIEMPSSVFWTQKNTGRTAWRRIFGRC